MVIELQSDFYTVVWTRYNQGMNNTFKDGDVDATLNAVYAVGDDAIQSKM
ncbi:MAG: putative metalloprotease [Flavobacterium sp.]|jgi:predicted metalloprotease